MAPDSAHADAYLAPSSAASHVTIPGPLPSITGTCDHQVPAQSIPRDVDVDKEYTIVARATFGPNRTSVLAPAAHLSGTETAALSPPRTLTHALVASHTTAISVDG
jgi:hypothetical protein